jgi:hypothetical protein
MADGESFAITRNTAGDGFPADPIDGSACGYQEPFALCGGHGHPARPTAAPPYVYASGALGDHPHLPLRVLGLSVAGGPGR